MNIVEEALNRSLVRMLERIDEDAEQFGGNGICVAALEEARELYEHLTSPELYRLTYKVGELLAELIKEWPEHSGCDGYPVPDSGGMDPFTKYYKADNMWTGEYGAARRRLANFLIERTKA